MGVMRSILLAASQNSWLREHAPRYRFVRRAVSRFMPGEQLEDALAAAEALARQGMGTLLTRLGENVASEEEANQTARHYTTVLDAVRQRGLDAEISVKLTQLGLDLSRELCYRHLASLIEYAGPTSVVWIDMEASPYVDVTLELYRRARAAFPNVGVCLQAYLYRTADDLASLLPLAPAIRLVKGAYREPAHIAFPRKRDVDENYYVLASRLLAPEARRAGVRAGIATHDRNLIRRIEVLAASDGLRKQEVEFQMLFGIQRSEQLRLAQEGYRTRVLISYGSCWFPWYMRRLAERPANLTFVLKNIFSS